MIFRIVRRYFFEMLTPFIILYSFLLRECTGMTENNEELIDIAKKTMDEENSAIKIDKKSTHTTTEKQYGDSGSNTSIRKPSDNSKVDLTPCRKMRGGYAPNSISNEQPGDKNTSNPAVEPTINAITGNPLDGNSSGHIPSDSTVFKESTDIDSNIEQDVDDNTIVTDHSSRSKPNYSAVSEGSADNYEYESPDCTNLQSPASLSRNIHSSKMEIQSNGEEIKSSNISCNKQDITDREEIHSIETVQSDKNDANEHKDLDLIISRTVASKPSEFSLISDKSENQAATVCLKELNENIHSTIPDCSNTNLLPSEQGERHHMDILESNKHEFTITDSTNHAVSTESTKKSSTYIVNPRKHHLTTNESEQQIMISETKKAKLDDKGIVPEKSSEDQTPSEQSKEDVKSDFSSDLMTLPINTSFSKNDKKQDNNLNSDTENFAGTSIKQENLSLTNRDFPRISQKDQPPSQYYSRGNLNRDRLTGQKASRTRSLRKMDICEIRSNMTTRAPNMVHFPLNDVEFLKQLKKPVLFDFKPVDGGFMETLRELGVSKEVSNWDISMESNEIRRTSSVQIAENKSDLSSPIDKISHEKMPSEENPSIKSILATETSEIDNLSSYKLLNNDITFQLLKFIGNNAFKNTCLMILVNSEDQTYGYNSRNDYTYLKSLYKDLLVSHLRIVREIEKQIQQKLTVIIVTSVHTYDSVCTYLIFLNNECCTCGKFYIIPKFDMDHEKFNPDSENRTRSKESESSSSNGDPKNSSQLDEGSPVEPEDGPSSQNKYETGPPPSPYHICHSKSCPSINFIFITDSTTASSPDSSQAPLNIDGNKQEEVQDTSGIFRALADANIIVHLKKEGIKYVNIISLNNLIANSLDPLAIGLMETNKYEILSKSVIKNENEAVGLFYNEDGLFCVREYRNAQCRGDLKEKRATSQWKKTNKRDIKQQNDTKQIVDSQLINICHHYFNIDFIERVISHKYSKLIEEDIEIEQPAKATLNVREQVHKSYMSGCFKYANSSALLLVEREKEFSQNRNNVEGDRDHVEDAEMGHQGDTKRSEKC